MRAVVLSFGLLWVMGCAQSDDAQGIRSLEIDGGPVGIGGGGDGDAPNLDGGPVSGNGAIGGDGDETAYDGGIEPAGSSSGIASCSIERWNGPDEDRRVYECVARGAGDAALGYDCDCAGVAQATSMADCSEALATACQLDLEQPQFCEYEMGTCWPPSEGGANWQCRCTDSTDVVAQAAPDCETAAFRACAAPCENDIGDSCTPSMEDFSYSCDCVIAEQSITDVLECSYALAHACSPFCVKTTGQCYPVEGGFACRCTGSDQSTTTETDAQTPDQCEAALDDQCGSAPEDTEITCSHTSDSGEGNCTIDAAGGHRCHCETTQQAGDSVGSGSGGEDGGTVEISEAICLAQLMSFCPPLFE